MDVIKKCDGCFYVKGSEDCVLADTEYCENKHNVSNLGGSVKLSAVVAGKGGMNDNRKDSDRACL